MGNTYLHDTDGFVVNEGMRFRLFNFCLAVLHDRPDEYVELGLCLFGRAIMVGWYKGLFIRTNFGRGESNG